MVQRPQHSTEQEPFRLEVENPGRLLGGGGLGIGALRKLGRRNLERVPKVWGLLGDGPPQASPVLLPAAEPASCPPGSCLSPPPSPLLCITQHLRRRCHNRLWQPRSGNEALEKPGAEPRGVNAPCLGHAQRLRVTQSVAHRVCCCSWACGGGTLLALPLGNVALTEECWTWESKH